MQAALSRTQVSAGRLTLGISLEIWKLLYAATALPSEAYHLGQSMVDPQYGATCELFRASAVRTQRAWAAVAVEEDAGPYVRAYACASHPACSCAK